MPIISVIVPCYQAGKFLSNCIECCLKQSFTDYELILVDDGSKDATLEICKLYERMDDRVKLIQSPHLGVSHARKLGIEHAKGVYIAFADSDDTMDEDWLSSMYECAAKSQADVVAASYYLEDHKTYVAQIRGLKQGKYSGAKYEKQILSNLFYHEKEKCYDYMPHLWNKLFRKEYMKQAAALLEDEVRRGEDCILCYGSLLYGHSLYYLDRSTYHYHKRVGSVMSQVPFSDTNNHDALMKNLDKLLIETGKIMYQNQLKLFGAYLCRLGSLDEKGSYKSSNKPVKVSVIVMIYRVEKYLSKCLESLCGQTLREMEFILVEDGSDDKCGEICDAFAKKDPRFVVLHRPHEGIVAGRQAGVEIAKGEFIGAVDGDDWIEPDMYEKLYETAIREGAKMCQCLFITNLPDRALYNHMGKHNRSCMAGKLYQETIGKNGMGYGVIRPVFVSHSLCDKIIEAELLKKIMATLLKETYFGEDGACVLQCLKRMDAISFVQEDLYHYRVHVGSVTREFDATVYDRIRALRENIDSECPKKQADALALRLLSMAIEKEYDYNKASIFVRCRNIKKVLKQSWVRDAVKDISISEQTGKKQKLMLFCMKTKLAPPRFLLGAKAKK